jgi:hypothetical protein
MRIKVGRYEMDHAITLRVYGEEFIGLFRFVMPHLRHSLRCLGVRLILTHHNGGINRKTFVEPLDRRGIGAETTQGGTRPPEALARAVPQVHARGDRMYDT